MNIDRLEGHALAATRVPEGCTMVMFDGAIRSSKTVSSLLLFLKFLRTGPEGIVAVVGRTERAAIDNVVMPLQGMLGSRRVVLNRGLGIVTILGRVVNLYGANDEQARTKIQGLTLAGAYVDEGANVPESFFNMLRSRLSVAGAMLFLTCNPEGPRHWLKVNWLDKAEWWLDSKGELHHFTKTIPDPESPGGMRNVHQPIYRVTFLLDHNLHLARTNPTFVAQLKASWPIGSVFYRRYIRSEWVAAEGAVYGMFDPAKHTVERADLPPIEQVLMAGVDYGTLHRTRGYLLGLCHVNMVEGVPDWGSRVSAGQGVAVLVVLAEWAPETATVGEHARLFDLWLTTQVRTWGMQPEWLAVDPAAATFKAELFARNHDDVMNAHNAVVPGIQTVQSLLTTGRLYVLTDTSVTDVERRPNRYLIDALPAYAWDTKATEKGMTKPLKVNDDEVDALRYVVYTSRRYWRDVIPLAPIDGQDSEPADEAA